MTEPLMPLPTTSSDRTTEGPNQPTAATSSANSREPEAAPGSDSPPGTPRWVKALGIVLVVLLLAFAGMHVAGISPSHMGGGSMQHGVQAP